MKRITYLLAVMLAVFLCALCPGCGKERDLNDSIEGNRASVFGDDFFQDVISIELNRPDAKNNRILTEADEIQKVFECLAGLSLEKSTEDIREYVGTSSLTVTYQNGAEVFLWFSDKLISDGDGTTYESKEDIYEKIVKLF